VNIISFVGGLAIVALTIFGVISVLILPRAPSGIGRVSLLVIRAVHLVGVGLSRLSRRYEAKDAILALVAPVSLVVQLLTWAGGLAVGFALMFVPTTHSFSAGLAQSFTALFTVGAIHAGGRTNTVIDVTAGATWVVIVALQIAYLPSLYSKFTHRESLVTKLESRAGSPTWGPELLVRHHFLGVMDAMEGLYEQWETWAADVSESHTTYPILLYFRSPDPWLSWVVGLLTVLDCAALHMTVVPSTAPANTRMILQTGFTTFERLAASMGWEVDVNPEHDAPIELTYEEFADAVALCARFGLTPEVSAEAAWPEFRGWRVNYERAAYRLADYLTAPPAPWSGTRRHLRPNDITLHEPPHQMLDRATGELSTNARSQVERMLGLQPGDEFTLPPSGVGTHQLRREVRPSEPADD
jgi:hypothetical protein